MNFAVLLAGGIGVRSKQDIPKQFISVFDQMLIIHVLQIFQDHPLIDGIVVACFEGWETILKSCAMESGITKLSNIVQGGENVQSSTRNALLSLEDTLSPDDIVVIHDSVRPLISEEIITDCIRTAQEHGSGLSAVRFQETIVSTEDGISGSESIHKDKIMRVQTPQAYRYGKALSAHITAMEAGITNAIYTNTMMLELGDTLYFSKGSEKNIKITTKEDIALFKALYKAKDERWFK
jgi:2-C-methyl-D-erythritol 4-phosphate cytidylyltransferase